VIHTGPTTYWYAVSQERHGGMVLSRPVKCWYGTPSHFQPRSRVNHYSVDHITQAFTQHYKILPTLNSAWTVHRFIDSTQHHHHNAQSIITAVKWKWQNTVHMPSARYRSKFKRHTQPIIWMKHT